MERTADLEVVIKISSWVMDGIGNELELEAITFVGLTVFLELATFTPDLR